MAGRRESCGALRARIRLVICNPMKHISNVRTEVHGSFVQQQSFDSLHRRIALIARVRPVAGVGAQVAHEQISSCECHSALLPLACEWRHFVDGTTPNVIAFNVLVQDGGIRHVAFALVPVTFDDPAGAATRNLSICRPITW